MKTINGLRQVSLVFSAFIWLGAQSTRGQATLSIDLGRPGHAIPPTLWGIFFEDINHSADGGIYPEMVRNCSFGDATNLVTWTFAPVDGNHSAAEIDNSRPLNPFNRESLRIHSDGPWILENPGYWGMNMVKGDSYTFRAAVRADGFPGALTVKLLNAAGVELAVGRVSDFGRDWKYHTLSLTAKEGDPQAKLQIVGSGQGTLFLDMVSLLPDKTWKNHGLRVDLAESLNALRPSFMRFPGGCWVEGDDMAHMNHWKNTIGNIDTRTPLWNIWGYYATHGLGFQEYLQLAEDLGATPLFNINVGMSHREVIPMDRMDQWVQDALDAIEYANGPTNSVWGARRAAAGHPQPFKLRYMEIGNENGGRAYRERWPLFVKAIREKYPYIQLVANHWEGSYPTNPAPNLVDEHYYESPEDFMNRASQYDKYDRHGTKVFVGEYAVTRNCGLGNLRAAIGEAAFMTGMERNSDVVLMACYAPLFVNLNHRAWNPDLINFDSAKWFGIPSYYVQQMFSINRGDVTLPVKVSAPAAETSPSHGMIGVGTWNTAAEFKDIQVTDPDGKVLFAADFSPGTQGWKMLGDGDWKVAEGALRQTAEKQFVRALAGDPHWTDYTLTLKARKLSGREGFLILFHIEGDEDRNWWNVGGWENTANAIEFGGTLGRQSGHIETGQWYDIRVQVQGKNVKCFLDGQLVHDLVYEHPRQVSSLYASASLARQTGEVILKVVNASEQALETKVEIGGTRRFKGEGTATILTSASGKDENSLSEPTKVSPKGEPVNFQGPSFTRVFPANSLTVFRLGKAK